jgi:hypothetical protein
MFYLNLVARPKGRFGVVVPMVAVMLVAVLGIAALAIDGGLLLMDRRNVQGAADAAALAAAIDLFTNSTTGLDTKGTAALSAQDTAKDNGFANGVNNTTVTVNIPPLSGTYLGQPGYAEVIITMQQPRLFSGVFGSGALPVEARSVAMGDQLPPPIGLLVLNTTQNNTLQMSASGSVNVSGGTVVVDSNQNDGLALSNTGGVTASKVILSGSTYATSATGTVNGLLSPRTGTPPTILESRAPTPDPLASFAAANTPSTLGMTQYTNAQINNFSYSSAIGANNSLTDNKGVVFGTVNSATQVTLNPGFYSGGLTINYNNPGVTFTLASGVYDFNQNVTFNGYGTVQSG